MAACKRFLTQSLIDCNKDKPAFKAGGTVIDQCATYSLTPTSREHLICASERAGTNTFDAGSALNAIKDFCGKDLLADPSVKDNTGGFSQDSKWPKGIARGSGQKGIGITVTFPGGCSDPDTPKASSFKTGGPDCHRILANTIIDNCDTSARQQKRGGSLISSGINGCVQWQLISTGG